MSISTIQGKQTQPLPVPRLEYDFDDEYTTRRQVEQNFEDLWSSIDRRLVIERRTYINDATLTADINLVEGDVSGGSITITLPPLGGGYQAVTIVKTDSSGNTVTISGADTDQIIGSSTLVISTQYGAKTLIPGSTEWLVI